jgi:hypothetical protein
MVHRQREAWQPKRILPALIASERAMPDNWNASLRVAQMESAAKNYAEAIAACNRGLSRTPCPAGRSWLLQTKADALTQKGQRLVSPGPGCAKQSAAALDRWSKQKVITYIFISVAILCHTLARG